MSVFIDISENSLEKVHYNYCDYPAFVRREFLSSYCNYSAPVHWHRDIELIAVISGEMDYNINGKVIKLKSGDALFVNSCVMHFGFSQNRTECDFICVLIHPQVLNTAEHFKNKYVLPITENSNLAFIQLAPEVVWQKNVIDSIISIYEVSNSETAPLKIQLLMLKIWNEIYENTNTVEYANSSVDENIATLREMINFISYHYAEKISLLDIALSGHICQSKCCKLFSKYINKTPNVYLADYRISRGKELLKSTDMTVTEIALSTGFNSASYFAETFKRYIGCSPGKYRAQYRAKK